MYKLQIIRKGKRVIVRTIKIFKIYRATIKLSIQKACLMLTLCVKYVIYLFMIYIIIN